MLRWGVSLVFVSTIVLSVDYSHMASVVFRVRDCSCFDSRTVLEVSSWLVPVEVL